MAGKILVGTCGWTDPTLLRTDFYPLPAKTAEARLQHYAREFPLVEVDSTYYALPSERNSRLWVERTPAHFLFDVKAFRLFTHHPTPLASLPRELRAALPRELSQKNTLYLREIPEEIQRVLLKAFLDALLPLDSAGKLGVVLFQFPPWFRPTKESREYILQAKEMMGQYRIAVEFRHNSWLNEENLESTLRFLEENELPFVAVDEPQGFSSSVPPVAAVTSDIALVRFHGRNRENWEKTGITATERFKYLYSEEELREWVPKIKEMASKAQQVHVLMNNCYADCAVKNGRQFQLMLD